jgi:hypothetical protein
VVPGGGEGGVKEGEVESGRVVRDWGRVCRNRIKLIGVGY